MWFVKTKILIQIVDPKTLWCSSDHDLSFHLVMEIPLDLRKCSLTHLWIVIARIIGPRGEREREKTKGETKIGSLTMAFVLGVVVRINSEMTIGRVPQIYGLSNCVKRHKGIESIPSFHFSVIRSLVSNISQYMLCLMVSSAKLQIHPLWYSKF